MIRIDILSFKDEFALMASIKTSKPPEGFLFAIVNSLETLIQLGVKISAAHHNHLNISLIYNDPKSTDISDTSLVSFILPFESRQWINIALQVSLIGFVTFCYFYDTLIVQNNLRNVNYDY